MKLYTEEQAKYFFECGRNFQMNGEVTFSDAQKEITPIELPSDEEIEKKTEYIPFITNDFYNSGFEEGAKWMKEQILNQNK